MRGIDLSDDTSAGSLAGPEFLMSVAERREEIETGTLSDTALFEAFESNAADLREVIEGLSAAFENDDLEAAKRLTVKALYLTKLHEAIQARMPVR